MPRVSPWGLARPERRQETRTFTDPAQPGITLDLSLRELGGVQLFQMTEAGQSYIREWVESGLPFAAEGGSLHLSETLCNAIAMLEAMQVPAPGEAAYNFSEWVGIADRFPRAIREIVEWAASLVTVETEEGNASRVAPALSLAPPSA